MFNNLTALGWGVVTFAITIGVGVAVLGKFKSAVASCATTHTYNTTDGYCYNSTGGDQQSASSGAQSVHYLEGQMGTSGLAGWTPAIIAFAVGMLFLGAFIIGKGKDRKY
jgi:hypothetical protein